MLGGVQFRDTVSPTDVILGTGIVMRFASSCKEERLSKGALEELFDPEECAPNERGLRGSTEE